MTQPQDNQNTLHASPNSGNSGKDSNAAAGSNHSGVSKSSNHSSEHMAEIGRKGGQNSHGGKSSASDNHS